MNNNKRFQKSRNETCPHGSANKNMKYCLGKAPTTSPIASAPPTTEPTAVESDLRFYPAIGLFLHPYVLIKLRDERFSVPSAKRQNSPGLQHLWRATTVSSMATDEIERRLTHLGVPYDAALFMKVAREEQSAWYIADLWCAGMRSLSQADEDFVGLAACELWRRRIPEHPSIEMIDDWMCEGYAYLARHDSAAAVVAWWKVWQALRPRITPEMKNMHEAGEMLFPCMTRSLSNWYLDFSLAACNSSSENPQCGEIGIRFSLELLALMPEEDKTLDVSSILASIYFQVGRLAEGKQLCQQLVRTHPERSTRFITSLLRTKVSGTI